MTTINSKQKENIHAVMYNLKKGPDSKRIIEKTVKLTAEKLKLHLNKTVLGLEDMKNLINYILLLQNNKIDVMGIEVTVNGTIKIYITNNNKKFIPLATMFNYKQSAVRSAKKEANEFTQEVLMGKGKDKISIEKLFIIELTRINKPNQLK